MRLMCRVLGCLVVVAGFATLIPSAWADELADGLSKVKVESVVPLKARAFRLEDVRLLDGPFKHAMELDRQVPAVAGPRPAPAHLPPQRRPALLGQAAGGWEEPKCELRGHFVGHYLTACALMYASTGDERLKEKGDAVVAGLAECQAKIGSGYLSAYPEEFIDRVEALQRVWAPYYTLHKIYAGLLDMYVYCDNAQALEVCKKFGDWVIARNARLTDEQMQKMLGNEHGGMNEALANLYGLTGEEKYLKIAQRFNHMAVLGPASKREDKLTGLHANTQIPKFVGTARQYELTGQDWLKTASMFFWDTVVKERSYVIGGHSDGEAFLAQGEALRGPRPEHHRDLQHLQHAQAHAAPVLLGPEGRVRRLLRAGPLQPHPLLAESRDGHDVLLRAAAVRLAQGVQHAAGLLLVLHRHRRREPRQVRRQHLLPRRTATLYVNLFIASELNWKAKGLKLRQETRYPEEAASRLMFTCEKPVELT